MQSPRQTLTEAPRPEAEDFLKSMTHCRRLGRHESCARRTTNCCWPVQTRNILVCHWHDTMLATYTAQHWPFIVLETPLVCHWPITVLETESWPDT